MQTRAIGTNIVDDLDDLATQFGALYVMNDHNTTLLEKIYLEKQRRTLSLPVLRFLKEKKKQVHMSISPSNMPAWLTTFLTTSHVVAENGDMQCTDTRCKDDSGNFPLHCAAKNGYLESVKSLQEKGADFNAVNDFHQTALHLAAQNGHKEIVRFLIDAGTSVNVKDFSWKTALDLALEYNQDEIVRKEIVQMLLYTPGIVIPSSPGIVAPKGLEPQLMELDVSVNN